MQVTTRLDHKLATKDAGGITIVMAMLLLILSLGSSVYTAKTKLLDIRIANAEYRTNQATLAAEAGLQHAIAHLDVNSGFTGNLAVNVGANSFTVNIGQVLDGGGDPINSPEWENDSVLLITATGTSDDNSGTRVMQQKVWVHSIARGAPNSAITVSGGMAVGGSFRVAANPNGGGSGVPLTVWSDTPVTITGNGATCALEEYDQGVCGNFPYSDKTALGGDIFWDDTIAAGGTFPDDLLDYTFGVPTSEYQTLKDDADLLLADCSSLNAASTGLIWVTGDCTINANTVVGSATSPVILIIQDADLRMNGGALIFGIVYSLDTISCIPANCGTISMTGGGEIRGAMISDHPIDISGGTLDIRYDPDVLAVFQDGNESIFNKVETIPGSWKDY